MFGFSITFKMNMNLRLMSFVCVCAKLDSQLNQLSSLYSITWKQIKIRFCYRRHSGVKSVSCLISYLRLQSRTLKSDF